MSVDEPVAPAMIVDLCSALQLPLNPVQHAQLAEYLQQLTRWNASFNITGVRDAREMVLQHLADCLAVVPPMERQLERRVGPRILDVGSGGGLPGVVLAVMLPGMTVTCVDKVGKKAAFVRQVAGLLGLRNLKAVHGRVEQLEDPVYDLITSRAFGTLSALVQASATRLAPDGAWAAMKGKVPTQEIAALPDEFAVFHVEHVLVPQLDVERCLVWIRRAKRDRESACFDG